MDKNRIGDFLKQLRVEKGLTQKDVARRLSVTDKTISRWERGDNLPDLESVGKLAAFFGVSDAEIVSGERADKEQSETEAPKTPPSALFKHFCQVILLLGLVRWVFICLDLSRVQKPAGGFLYRWLAVSALAAAGWLFVKKHGEKIDIWLEKREGKSKKGAVAMAVIARAGILAGLLALAHKSRTDYKNAVYAGDYFEHLVIAGSEIETESTFFTRFANNAMSGDIQYALKEGWSMKEIKVYPQDKEHPGGFFHENEDKALPVEDITDIAFGDWGALIVLIIENENGKTETMYVEQERYCEIVVNSRGAVLNVTEFHFDKNGEDYTLLYTDENCYDPDKKDGYQINKFKDFKYFAYCYQRYMHGIVGEDIFYTEDNQPYPQVVYNEDGGIITFRVAKEYAPKKVYVAYGGRETSIEMVEY